MYTLYARSCPLNAIFAMPTKINGKSRHIRDIMFISNQLKKVRRTVRPTNAVWADFIRNENGTSMNVKLHIRGYWERFPIKVFESKHCFSLGLCVNNHRPQAMCGSVPFPPVFRCNFGNGKYFLNIEHEQRYGSICSIGEYQRSWIKEGD